MDAALALDGSTFRARQLKVQSTSTDLSHQLGPKVYTRSCPSEPTFQASTEVVDEDVVVEVIEAASEGLRDSIHTGLVVGKHLSFLRATRPYDCMLSVDEAVDFKSQPSSLQKICLLSATRSCIVFPNSIVTRQHGPKNARVMVFAC